MDECAFAAGSPASLAATFLVEAPAVTPQTSSDARNNTRMDLPRHV